MSGIVKAIKKVVKGVVKAVVKVVKTVVKAVVDVAKSVINFVTQPFMGLFGMGGIGDIPDAGAEARRQEGVLVTTTGSVQDIPVVYGYRKVGGKITFAETGSANNQYLWVAYALSEGPVEGVRDIYIDDYQLPASIVEKLNNGQTVDITEGKYKDRVKIQFSHGTYFSNPENSTVGSWSICSDAPSWKNSMVYNGLAVMFVRYYWKKVETQDEADSNPFGGSIPNLQAGVLGKKVASLDIANPLQYEYDAAPVRYSSNPAECLWDYLRNPRYGKGMFNSDFEITSWKQAAAKCNQIVEYVNGIKGPIHTLNYVVDTNFTLFANTKSILMNFRSYMPFIQGKYRLRIEDAGNETDILSGSATIVQTFTPDDIIGTITFNGIDRSSKYNQVSVLYVNPDNKWANDSVVYPEDNTVRQQYIDEDGGRENKLEIMFSGITNYAIAKDMARLLFNKSRYQESVSFTATSKALELEVGDNIFIQSEMLNFGTTPFRVVSMRINNDMSVELGCVRNEDTIYPHTRYGEEDIVLPVYTPKGVEIFYPAISLTNPVGLVPPKKAVVPVIHYPPSITDIDTRGFTGDGVKSFTVSGRNFQDGITVELVDNQNNPVTPNTVSRTGTTSLYIEVPLTIVGSPYDIVVTNSSDYGSLSARQNNAIEVDAITIPTPLPDPPIQDPPEEEPPEDPIITPDPTPQPPEGPGDNDPPEPEPEPLPLDHIFDIEEIDYRIDDGLVYATLIGKQPDYAGYNSLDIYYRRQGRNTLGWKHINFSQKPGPNSEMRVDLGPLLQSRAIYEVIIRVKYDGGDYSTRNTTINLDTFNAEDTKEPKDKIEIVGEGWTPPEISADKVIRDTPVAFASGDRSYIKAAVAGQPRSIDFWFQQDIYNFAPNWNIIGVALYYKASVATNWRRKNITFGDAAVPGTVLKTGFQEVFGVNISDSSDNNPPSAAQQEYDVVFRWLLRDGTEGTKQLRVMKVRTEYGAFGWYSEGQDILYGIVGRKENVGDYNMPEEDPNAPNSAEEIWMDIDLVYHSIQRNINEIQYVMRPPDSSFINDWAGMDIRMRKVIPGANPKFEVISSNNVTLNKTSFLAYYYAQLEYDVEYEFVLTPKYYDNGVRKLSKYSWFGSGYMISDTRRFDYPPTGNWKYTHNYRKMSTADAIGDLTQPFPAPVNPRVNVGEWKLIYPGQRGKSWEYYYKLTFNHQHLAGYTKLNVYRRYRMPGNSTEYKTSKAYMTSWEKVEITQTNNGGDVTVYLRPPRDRQIYNPYWDPDYSGTNTRYLNKFNSWTYPIVLNFSKSTIVGDKGEEYLIVAENSGGESTVGLLLPMVPKGTEYYGGEVDGLSLGYRVQEVEVSSYNSHDAKYGKNLNQADARYSDSAMAMAYYDYAGGYRKYDGTGFKSYDAPIPTPNGSRPR